MSRYRAKTHCKINIKGTVPTGTDAQGFPTVGTTVRVFEPGEFLPIDEAHPDFVNLARSGSIVYADGSDIYPRATPTVAPRPMTQTIFDPDGDLRRKRQMEGERAASILLGNALMLPTRNSQ